MSIVGYQVGRVYVELASWWVGVGSLSEVELKLGFKHPFLSELFSDAEVIDCRGFKEEGVTFQDAVNVLLFHLVLMGFRRKKEKSTRN